MALEIEHKFLVISGEYKEIAYSRKEILQGYLSRDKERTVRIRIIDGKGFLTVKGRNAGAVRKEFEYEIPIAEAEELIEMCVPPVIDKVRWYVEFGGKTWEIDEFKGDLFPLVLAEVELKSESEKFDRPAFIGEDVTNNPVYYNSNLSTNE